MKKNTRKIAMRRIKTTFLMIFTALTICTTKLHGAAAVSPDDQERRDFIKKLISETQFKEGTISEELGHYINMAEKYAESKTTAEPHFLPSMREFLSVGDPLAALKAAKQFFLLSERENNSLEEPLRSYYLNELKLSCQFLQYRIQQAQQTEQQLVPNTSDDDSPESRHDKICNTFEEVGKKGVILAINLYKRGSDQRRAVLSPFYFKKQGILTNPRVGMIGWAMARLQQLRSGSTKTLSVVKTVSAVQALGSMALHVYRTFQYGFPRDRILNKYLRDRQYNKIVPDITDLFTTNIATRNRSRTCTVS